ncbi:GNAT family N-acetyltransferase [Streptomyces cinerochromogenes]|uniref:GNAT family N-acetyltransferase n=1 Tax=Streptomyces cinerochromogenes TaxID=66422 RepID=UPI0033ACD76F
MQIEDTHGLPVAVVSVQEALGTDWETWRGRVAVVRVGNPPEADRPALRKAGFLPKPSWLTWIADTRATEEEFLRGLHRKERQSVQAARRHAAASDLRVEVLPLTEPLLEEFLGLYERQMARMRQALPVAVQQRDQLREASADLYAVCARQAGTLVGACLSQRLPEADLVRLRFSAVDERSRSHSLARVLYMAAIGHARELGFGQVSLGNDPNLYGHVVEAGLFAFKTRLGFRPVPSQTVHPHRGDDSADLVLGGPLLADPALLLSYPETADGDGPAAPLRMELFTATDAPDASRYTGSYGGEVRVHALRPAADRDDSAPAASTASA